MNPLIVANWKCHPVTLKEAERLFDFFEKQAGKEEVVICPPFVYLVSSIKYQVSSIKIGAQDCFWRQEGAFTGEISPKMLKDLGCDYVILGHSERRIYLKETDGMINQKLKAALAAGLKPILCVGETGKQKKQKQTLKVLTSQLKKALDHLTAKSLNHLLVVYEPIWAISSQNGRAVRPKEANQAREFIEKILLTKFGSQAKSIKILYGGSVDSRNIKEYIKIGFQGVLVGAASLNNKEFIRTIKALRQ